MDSTPNGSKVYGAGGFGSPSTGAVGGGRAGPTASLSSNRETSVVVDQATASSSVTGTISPRVTRSAAAAASGSRTMGHYLEQIEREIDSDASSVASSTISARSRARKRPGAEPVASPTKRRVGADAPPLTDDDESTILQQPASPYCRSSERGLPGEDDISAELRLDTSGSLAARILENMDVVERVSTNSKNLKGSFVRQLRLAARTVRVAAKELVGRGSGDADNLQRENASLRSQVAGLRSEISRLSVTVRSEHSLRATGPAFIGRPQDDTVCPSGQEPMPPPPAAARRPATAAHTSAVDEDRLLCRIADLVEDRLAAFRMELLAISAHHPPQARVTTASTRIDAVRQQTRRAAQSGKQNAPAGPTGLPKPTQPRLVSEGNGAQPQQQNPAPTRNTASVETWARVVGRKQQQKKKKKNGEAAPSTLRTLPSTSTLPAPSKPSKGGGGRGAPPTTRKETRQADRKTATAGKKKAPSLGRPPKNAAVSVTVEAGARVSYAEALATARSKIDLAELGISGLRPRRAANGGLLLEVSGPDGPSKASSLAGAMAKALEGSGVRIAQPVKTAELRIRGLDDSVRAEEVAAALAKEGGCTADEVRVGTIRTSPPSGLGSVWARCPLAAARRVVGAGRLLVGWSSARVEVLGARPLQCYRCLEMGHVRQRCTSAVDRGGLCYRCGAPDHRANRCTAPPRCPLCADLGRPAGHRLGAKSCAPAPSKRRRSKGGTTSTVAHKEAAGAVAVPVQEGRASDAPPAGVEEAPPQSVDAPGNPELGLEEAMVVE